MMIDTFDPARFIAIAYMALLVGGAVLALVRGRPAAWPLRLAERIVTRVNSPLNPPLNPPAPSASRETI